ncbi:MAG: glutamate--tRNA ligase family protein [Bdellovibrionota bacterium]
MEKWTRFAPTPSGHIHLGNALNFFLIWAWARREKMSIALRIDDIDRSRFRLEYLDDIFASLNWLQLDYHAGPISSADFLQNFSQNLRHEKYLSYAKELRDSGFAYYCKCSRKDIEERFGTASYQGSCREKGLRDGILRLNLESCRAMKYLQDDLFQDLMKEIGDLTLVGRDKRATYQLVSVIDDVQLGITHVMRGEDLLTSTHIQKLLAKILNLASFSNMTFCFHALVRSPDGAKLSKSGGAFALKNLYLKANHPAEFYLWASSILLKGIKCESAKQLADSLPENYFDNQLLQFV